MLLVFTRWGIPALLVVAGAVLLAIPGTTEDAYGLTAIGVAILVLLFNLGLRLSMTSGGDRDREEAARRHFAEHGVWPDEEDSLATTGRRRRSPDG